MSNQRHLNTSSHLSKYAGFQTTAIAVVTVFATFTTGVMVKTKYEILGIPFDPEIKIGDYANNLVRVAIIVAIACFTLVLAYRSSKTTPGRWRYVPAAAIALVLATFALISIVRRDIAQFHVLSLSLFLYCVGLAMLLFRRLWGLHWATTAGSLAFTCLVGYTLLKMSSVIDIGTRREWPVLVHNGKMHVVLAEQNSHLITVLLKEGADNILYEEYFRIPLDDVDGPVHFHTVSPKVDLEKITW